MRGAFWIHAYSKHINADQLSGIKTGGRCGRTSLLHPEILPKWYAFINLTSAELTTIAKIWIHVPSERPNERSTKGSPMLRGVIEKKTMINLVSRQ
jgi:hypothetical protein